MTYDTIRIFYKLQSQSDKKTLQLLTSAVPSLKYTARAEAAQHYEVNEDSITQALIQKYVLHTKEYNAIEISHILKEAKDGRSD